MKKLLLIIPVLIAVILVALSMQLSVKPGGGMLSISLSNTAYAQEEYNADYDIVFNPTGTHFTDAFSKGDDGQLKIRLDFYPHEGTKAYEQQHVYVPVEPIPSYPGEVDKEGNPLDWEDYNHWYDSLPREWRTNPALCLFVKIDSLTTTDELESYIASTFTPEMIATIDNAIIREDSAHLISPLLKDKASITSGISIGDKTSIITDTNTKFSNFTVSGNSSGISLDIQPQSIDIGSEAIDRNSNTDLGSTSRVLRDNPANADGTINTIEIFLQGSTTVSCFVGTVSMSGTSATIRDYENLGAVSSGSKQTFNGLSIDCITGDYLGDSNYSGGNGYIKMSTDAGTGYWYKYSIDIYNLSGTTMSSNTGTRTLSLYGTGTEGGGDPDISVLPITYDFGVVAESTEPYTATDYFTITNNSTMQTDQTISVTTSSWSGGVTWTHSDTATAGSDTAGLKANRGGTWGTGDVIVKYSTPDFIYENCPATTGYDFGLKLISPTAFTDGIEKEIVVRITATAD